jgi:DNA-binding XRE family transcriptional regulator
MNYNFPMDDELRRVLEDIEIQKTAKLLSPQQQLAHTVLANNRQLDFTIMLIRARLSRHLSQSDLAAIVGTTQSTISHIEGRKGNPRLSTLLLIAEALGVTLRLD